MKRLTTLLLLSLLIATAAQAQYCGSPVSGITPHTDSIPGLSPASDVLPCRIAGQYSYDTLYFCNFSSFAGMTVSSLTIDSIGNLPAGLCWSTNKANNTFAGGENGIILISGTTNDPAGQYKLRILIHAVAGAISLPPYTDAETVAALRYYLRVACPNAGCSSIDTVNGKTNLYLPDPSCSASNPTAQISSSAGNTVCTGTTVTLYANVGNGFSYLWSTGETTQTISVSSSGIYSMTLTYNGSSTTASIQVSVNPTPTAYFAVLPDTATAHLWYINNLCTGQGLSYSWSWGDSSANGSGATPSHTYTTAGYYDVCVSITSDSGCVASYCDSSVYLYKTDNQMIELHVRQNPSAIATTTADAQNIRYYAGAVHFATAIATPTDIKLYDLAGRLVMSYDRFTGSVLDVHAADFAGGVYIIHLQNGTSSLSKKLTMLP